MRPLHRPRDDRRVGQLVVHPVEGHAVRGEALPQDREGLVEPALRLLLARHAVEGQLGGGDAPAHAQVEPPAGQLVEGHRLLDDAHRVVQRQDRDERPQPQPRGPLRGRRQHQVRRRRDGQRRPVVLGQVVGVEAKPVVGLDQLKPLSDLLDVRPSRVVVVVDDPEAHAPNLTPLPGLAHRPVRLKSFITNGAEFPPRTRRRASLGGCAPPVAWGHGGAVWTSRGITGICAAQQGSCDIDETLMVWSYLDETALMQSASGRGRLEGNRCRARLAVTDADKLEFSYPRSFGPDPSDCAESEGERAAAFTSMARTRSAASWFRRSLKMARACSQAWMACARLPAAWRVSPRWTRASASLKRSPASRCRLSARW